MAKVIPSGHTLGASVEGLDLSRPLSAQEFEFALNALAEHGVLRYPRQELTALQLRDFSARWGELEINVANMYQEPGVPEVMILSNIVENGRPIGLADAGQSWHTDMSYSRTIAFCNVLYGIRIPQRHGEPLGNTEFCDQRAAYDELPPDLRKKLEGKTVLHDFNKFWEMMRREKGSARPALTEAQRKAKPPVSHPIFLPHPITGRKALYANPGYSVRINELPQKESDAILEFLFEHQTQPRFRFAARWQVGDVLMWDNLRTIHNAVADYSADEPRRSRRLHDPDDHAVAQRERDPAGRPEALRPNQGFCADQPGLVPSAGDGHPGRCAVQLGPGRRAGGEGEAGRSLVRFGRERRLGAPRRRAGRDALGHQDDARPVPRQRARADRGNGGPRQLHVLPDGRHRRPGGAKALEGACGQHREAASRLSGRSDDGRERVSRLRAIHARTRRSRARQHARACHRQIERGSPCLACEAGDERQTERAGRHHPGRQLAGGVPCLAADRCRALGARDQGRGRQGRVKSEAAR